MHAKSLQSCPTLCNTMDCNLAVSSVHGDSPSKNTGVVCHFLFQGNLSDPGIQPVSFMSPALAGGFITRVLPGKSPYLIALLISRRRTSLLG